MSLLKVSEITDLTGAGSTYMPGHVVQAVTFSTQNVFNTSVTNTWVNTNLSATITPKSASSKIFIFCSASLVANVANGAVWQTIFRNSTNLGGSSNGLSSVYIDELRVLVVPGMIHFVDSPNTTSAVTYNHAIRVGQTGGGSGDGVQGRTITLMEIAQ